MLDSVMASPASPPVTISRKGRRARVLLSDSDSSPLCSPAVAPKPSLLQPPSLPSCSQLGDCSPHQDQAAHAAAAMRSGTDTPLAGTSDHCSTAAPLSTHASHDAAAMRSAGTGSALNHCSTATPASSSAEAGHPTAANAMQDAMQASMSSSTPCGVGFLQAITHSSTSSSFILHGSGQMEQNKEEEEEDAPLAFQRSVRRAGARHPSFLLDDGDEEASEGGSPAAESSPPAAPSPPAAFQLPPLSLSAATCNDDEEGSDVFFTPDGALTPDEAFGEDTGLPGFDVRPSCTHDGVLSPLPVTILGFSSDALTGRLSAASVTAGEPCSNFSRSVTAGAPSGGYSTAHPTDTPTVCSGGGHGGQPSVDRLILLSSSGVASASIGGNVRGSSSNSRRLVSGFGVSSSSASSRGGSGGALVFTRSVYRCAGRRRLLEEDEDDDDEEGGGSGGDGAGRAGECRPEGGPVVTLDFDTAEGLTPGVASSPGDAAGRPRGALGRLEVHAFTGGSVWRKLAGHFSPRCSPSPGLNVRPASATATTAAADSMAAVAAKPTTPATSTAAAAASLAAVAIRLTSTATGIYERKAVSADLDVRKAPPFTSDVIVISSDDEGDEAGSSSRKGGESGDETERSASNREYAASPSLLVGHGLPDSEKMAPTPMPPPPSRPRQIRGALELASLMNRQLSLADVKPVSGEGEEEEEGVIDLASSSCGSDTDRSDDGGGAGRGAGPVGSIDLALSPDPRPPRGILSLLGGVPPGPPQGMPQGQIPAPVDRGKASTGSGRGAPSVPPLVPHPPVIKGGGRHIGAAPKPAAAPRIPSITSPDAK